MKEGYFDARERAREKQASRDEDQRQLDTGEITREALAKRNGFFSSLDLSSFKVVYRRYKMRIK